MSRLLQSNVRLQVLFISRRHDDIELVVRFALYLRFHVTHNNNEHESNAQKYFRLATSFV